MSFYQQVITRDPRFRRSERIDDLALLEPETAVRVLRILEGARHLGIRLGVFETYRSAERQGKLHRRGATQLRLVGVHHYGLACDLVKLVGDEWSWKGDFSFLGDLARQQGLIWGGDWGRPGVVPRFYDGVHVQRCAVKHQSMLFAGTWYPDPAYDPYLTAAALAAPPGVRGHGPARPVE